MTIDEKKAKVQAEASEAIDKASGFGLIAMATGTGKSKIGVDRVDTICTNFQPQYTLSKPKILLVVPTEKLRDEGWKAEFEKWNMSILWDNFIERTCYASLHNYEGEDFDLVILDECHNITENNSIFFHNNVIKSCIGLTATPPTDLVKIQLLAKILHLETYRDEKNYLRLRSTYLITLDQAVEMGLIAPYDITIVTMPLDDKNKYILAGKVGKQFYQTEKQRYDYLSRLCDFGTNPMNRINRMRFIYNLKSKTVTAINILKHVIPQDIKTLIFCGSKEQANLVCLHRYYSKPTPPKKLSAKDSLNPVKLKKYSSDWVKHQLALEEYQGNDSYNLFFEGLINRLSCVEALNEGHNLPNIDCGLVIQLNSQQLDFIQRMGRIIRLRDGHIGRVIILAVEDTVDIEWVNKAIKGLNNTKIRWIKLDDLRNARETITF